MKSRNVFGIKGLAGAAAIALGTLAGFEQAKATDMSAVDTHSGVLWAGVGFKEDVVAAYIGGVLAVNGDINSSGLQVRLSGTFVDYEFRSGFAPSGKADGELYRGNASLGYQIAMEAVRISLFAGVDVQDRDINPAAANDGRLKNEAGFFVSGRVASNTPGPFSMSVEGNYSTANSSYWTQAKLGYRFGSVKVGPEIGVLGNDVFDELRIGGNAEFGLLSNLLLQVNAGYAEKLSGGGSGGSGGDGAYGGGTLVFLF